MWVCVCVSSMCLCVCLCVCVCLCLCVCVSGESPSDTINYRRTHKIQNLKYLFQSGRYGTVLYLFTHAEIGYVSISAPAMRNYDTAECAHETQNKSGLRPKNF